MENPVTLHTFQNNNVLCNQCFIDTLCIKEKKKIRQGKALVSLFPVDLFQHRERCVWNADVAGSVGVRVVCLSLLLGGEDGVSVFLTYIKQYKKNNQSFN